MTTAEIDPLRSRARFYAPELAFDRPIPRVPAAVFAQERDQAFDPAATTGLITLDQSEALGCAWPATTPTMLARYIVISPCDKLEHHFAATGEAYYVLSGHGLTLCDGDTVPWKAGDVFCLPGATPVVHQADARSVLLVVTNEPELAYLRAEPDPLKRASIRPTLFPADETALHLRSVHGRNGEQRAAGKSVVFLTELMEARRLTTPTLLAAMNSLEPGGDQRPHRHSSAALTLSIAGEGVYSVVDGERVDWSPNLVFVTPPGAVHSHHNPGTRMMKAFVVQDTGLHSELRTTNFAWVD
jgi:gentisate 1,2-dioxygenase